MRIPNMIELIVADPLALELAWDNGVLLGTKILWSQGRIPTGMTAAAKMLRDALVRYVAGDRMDWPRVPMAYHEQPEFTAKVLKALQLEVGYGQTVSYGELAAMAGSPGAARAVGRIMATNPWPLIVPCHRVVGSDGALTGYSAEGGLDMKKYLLELEGSM
ncbi:methylated-DNA--[protein]-cysteine S-methyltransferase [Desulfovibrio ferrophilus]|uniref:Methylated-DNA--protein-cysteine methyltransferase n=1 Tax=Desulfovibrio ferrophilus TaxID=241368 RepID=A0A2Z6B2G3_9BACT|nr:MGMT family protein [Desulfovibrio ferrophilus]BBD09671.1 putative methylated-DNA--protein-cysteine methyltransferase [Desulfovibrio ferrophilus]